MRVVIEKDDGTQQVFKGVTDYLFVVRQLEPLQKKDSKGMAFLPETRGYSFNSGNMREIVKESNQCIGEMQDILRMNTNSRGPNK